MPVYRRDRVVEQLRGDPPGRNPHRMAKTAVLLKMGNEQLFGRGGAYERQHPVGLSLVSRPQAGVLACCLVPRPSARPGVESYPRTLAPLVRWSCESNFFRATSPATAPARSSRCLVDFAVQKAFIEPCCRAQLALADVAGAPVIRRCRCRRLVCKYVPASWGACVECHSEGSMRQAGNNKIFFSRLANTILPTRNLE